MTAGDYLPICKGGSWQINTTDTRWGGYAVAEVINPRKRKKIVADYVALGSYAAAARINDVAPNSVKRIVAAEPEIARLCAQKKEQDTQDVLAYMGQQSDLVCEIIGKGLTALADEYKLAAANPAQITTAIGTLIDKWTMVRDRQTQSGVQVDLGGAEEYSG